MYYRGWNIMEKPELEGGSMQFTQEADSCNSGIQQIDFEVLDAGGGKYVLFKTEGWSISNSKEFEELYDKVKIAFDIEDEYDK